MPLLYIKENTTVGELKKFLANVPDDSSIFTTTANESNIRFDDYVISEDKHELYIEEV